MSGTLEMLGFMDFSQKICWVLGAVCSTLTGLCLPTFALVFGEVVSTFDPQNSATLDDLMTSLLKSILIVAATIFILGYVNYALMQQAAEQLTIKLRGMYLRSLLR